MYDLATHSCPEGVGGVASAALVNLLAAAVWNNVLVQSSVPVFMVHHTTTLPLSRRTGRSFKTQQRDQFSPGVVWSLPLSVWSSRRPSDQRCCLCCTTLDLLSGPVWHFHSPGGDTGGELNVG